MAIDCLAVWPAAFSIVLFCKGRRVLVVVPYHTPIVTCLDASFSLGVGGGGECPDPNAEDGREPVSAFLVSMFPDNGSPACDDVDFGGDGLRSRRPPLSLFSIQSSIQSSISIKDNAIEAIGILFPSVKIQSGAFRGA